MKSDEAKALFHGKDKLNCAQAVLKAFQTESGMSDEDIASAADAGGGKAEGGLCGALYATKLLLKNPAIQERFERDFETRAGALVCKEIRKLKQLPCRDCVALAAELFEKHSNEG